jgi:hypothetical protein
MNLCVGTRRFGSAPYAIHMPVRGCNFLYRAVRFAAMNMREEC